LVVKVLTLRRDDVCVGCSAALRAGTRATWDSAKRVVWCAHCADTASAISCPPAHPVLRPAAETVALTNRGGASAQREYERRSQNRERRIRAAHPRLGGLLLALSDEPAQTRVWAQGASGERAVAAALDALVDVDVLVMHDRVLPRPDGRQSRANIDHVAVAASGVWVIDAKTHKGSLEVRRSGGLFGPRVEKLYIGGRDKCSLVVGLQEQVAAVRAALDSVDAGVPVRGALCFVGTELPWFGSSSVDGVPLVGRRGLTKLLKAAGELSAQDRASIAEFLASRFPPALV
jgi:hypothetical protein